MKIVETLTLWIAFGWIPIAILGAALGVFKDPGPGGEGYGVPLTYDIAVAVYVGGALLIMVVGLVTWLIAKSKT